MKRFVFFIFVLPFLQSAITFAQTGGASELYETISKFDADRRSLQRKYTPRESAEYYNRMIRHYSEWKERLDDMDINSFSVNGKADFVMLSTKLNEELYFLKKEFDAFKEVSFVAERLEPLYEFIRHRRNGKIPDYKNLAGTFHELAQVIPNIQKELMDKPFDDYMVADKAAGIIDDLRESLEESYEFYFAYDPMFTWWMEKPYASLDAALESYEQFLEEHFSKENQKDDGSGIIGRPIGKQALQRSLEFSFIPYSAEELIEAAEVQFKYCEEEMLKASRELGFGEDWRAALEHTKNTYVPPAHQPEIIDSLAWEAIHFIEERDLITIPELAKETWRMRMMSPQRQLINPFFTGGEVISISYPTNTMDHDDKMMSMRGNNPNFSTATVHHELIPGHHLQGFMTSRYKPYRGAFSTAFWGEGWALYWEILLWNKDFPDTPEERIGMLFWRMHRCARIIFSLSYHLELMTPQECIDLLVDRVGHEYANAEAEVRRSFVGGYDPLYQIAYMVGGLQFYALRNEMLEMGWTEKQYHDAVMREGRIPVEILRSILQEQELKKNFTTRWKFSTDFK